MEAYYNLMDYLVDSRLKGRFKEFRRFGIACVNAMAVFMAIIVDVIAAQWDSICNWLARLYQSCLVSVKPIRKFTTAFLDVLDVRISRYYFKIRHDIHLVCIRIVYNVAVAWTDTGVWLSWMGNLLSRIPVQFTITVWIIASTMALYDLAFWYGDRMAVDWPVDTSIRPSTSMGRISKLLLSSRILYYLLLSAFTVSIGTWCSINGMRRVWGVIALSSSRTADAIEKFWHDLLARLKMLCGWLHTFWLAMQVLIRIPITRILVGHPTFTKLCYPLEISILTGSVILWYSNQDLFHVLSTVTTSAIIILNPLTPLFRCIEYAALGSIEFAHLLLSLHKILGRLMHEDFEGQIVAVTQFIEVSICFLIIITLFYIGRVFRRSAAAVNNNKNVDQGSDTYNDGVDTDSVHARVI